MLSPGRKTFFRASQFLDTYSNHEWCAGLLRFLQAHETNIAPENDPLEKENPIGNHHF